MRRWLAFFQLALRQLRRNKTRAGLTMLGIIIGVSSVILLLAIGNGLKVYIRQQFESLGSNLIYIMPGQMIQRGHYNPRGEMAALAGAQFDSQDLRRLRRLAAVKRVAPLIMKNETVAFANRESNATLVGTTSNLAALRKFKFQEGRFFSRQEEIAAARVVVLGAAVKDDLFGPRPALGRRIIIGRQKYRVIGVLKAQGGMRLMGGGFDSRFYLPYRAAFHFVTQKKFAILVAEAQPGQLDLAKKEMQLLLAHRYHRQDFSVTDQAEILTVINSILGVLTLALADIAAISLLVGGIGIMNIMFVSVSERVREIGLRKAVGATAADIEQQFLLEAVVLAITGGFLGVILGLLGALVLNQLFPAVVNGWSILLAFGISALIGIIFGVVPAKRAARLSPIEALRYE